MEGFIRISLSCFILAFCLAGSGSAETKPEFSFTVDEYLTRLNTARQYGFSRILPSRYIITGSEVDGGSIKYNVTGFYANTNMMVQITANKATKAVQIVNYIRMPATDLSWEASIRYFASELAVLVMGIENPRMSKTDRTDRVGELQIVAAVHNESYQKTTKNGIMYIVSYKQVEDFFTFAAQPEE